MTEPQKKYVAYYRVSTDKQGELGLGMQSQKEVVENFVRKGNGAIIKSYVEVKSGKNAINRAQLMLALKDCKRHKAILVVAKLDRLGRNVHFISGLQESRVKFVPADFPEVDETFILMGAVFAQHERRMISERTKAALVQAKKNGKKLGSPKIKEIVTEWNKTQTKQSILFAKRLQPIITEFLLKKYSTRKMASELVRMRVKTPLGQEKWTPVQVVRVINRLNFINDFSL